MKKSFIFVGLLILCCLWACGNTSSDYTSNNYDTSSSVTGDSRDTNVKDSDSTYSINTDTDSGYEEDSEMDAINRTIIAKALNVQEDSRNIRFIISCLNTIEAGQLQKAELIEENNEKMLDIVAEDNTPYRVYLTSNGTVYAVKNLSTGEWPILSSR